MTVRVIELLGPAAGGIKVHVTELTTRLRGAGADVIVAGPSSLVDLVDRAVDVPRTMSPFGLVRARRQLADVPGTLIHAHGLKAGWVAVTSRPRRSVVLTAHNLVLDETAGASAALQRYLEHALARRVDHLISPSRTIDAHFAADLPAERRSVVLPVSPAPRPRRDRAEVRESLEVTDAQPLVVAVARLHPQKDLPTLLRAFARVVESLPDARLAVIGDGPSRSSIEMMIGELGIENEVRLEGIGSYAVDEMAAADVVALTSIWEAVPLVVVEALGLGLPVVTTRVGIVDELVGDTCGAVVPVGDHEAVADALLARLTDPDLRQAESRASRERATRLASPERLAAAVQAVYELVAAGPPR